MPDRFWRRPRIVVYTALFGERDAIPAYDWNGVAHSLVCFTDRSDRRHDQFNVVQAPPLFADPNRCAKLFKVLPHVFFPGYDYSVWFDGCIQFKRLDPVRLVRELLRESDLAAFSHPERSCLYEEARVCVEHRRDDPATIQGQVEHYQAEGVPRAAGLSACGFLVRRHTRALAQFSLSWWAEIARFSRRDQISFAYLRWKHGLKQATIPGSYWDNEIFTYGTHLGAEWRP